MTTHFLIFSQPSSVFNGSSQVQYQKLFQMIFMLGIGGCFTIGFQISMINYPSVVRKPLCRHGLLKYHE